MTLFLKSAALAAYLLATGILSVLQIDDMLKTHYTRNMQVGGMTPMQVAKAMEE